VYATVLAMLSLSVNEKWSCIAARHLNGVLISTFLVYLYRDVFPLVTYPLAPMDLWEGHLLWPKVIALFAVSGIIPLLIPRQYIPLDSKNPMLVPNPEQTASILSSVLYIFLDPIVSLAYRIPHLSFNQLPPLCDYDYASVLKARAFPHLDAFRNAGEKRARHVAFGLLWTFRWEHLIMAILLAISGLANFISPLAINRLLNYLEKPDAEYFMRPWFWIVLLFVGPVTYDLAFQWDMFVGTHIMGQTTAIVTQLVFEHALRIRVKAETADKGKNVASSETASANLTGKINTLVTVDLGNINEARNVLFIVVLVPIQVIGSVIFLYQVLGWSAFVGMAFMAALSPLPGYAAKLLSGVQKKALDKTDARVQSVSETMGVLRMVKMFGWESQMMKKIEEKRKDELTWIWRRKALFTLQESLNFLIPTITMLATYGQFCSNFVFIIIMKQELSASKVFSSMAVFDLLRAQIWFTLYCTNMVVKAKVSLDRLNEFLNKTELLDSFSFKDSPDIAVPDHPAADTIGFRDAMFTWSKGDEAETDGTVTPASWRFVLKVEGELYFKPGCINLVVGPTGSGKTSLLMALLGEMYKIPSGPSSWFNLPRKKGVSFAAQESWVLNDTIKNNILFNAPMHAERYKKVIHQCGLERDLELFDAGDETEVGEKGVTLSGGQKARVTLARAIYSDSQIVLLDDILAALDVHTAKWVVEKCFQGSLIENRTVILVTHNVALTSKIADFVVSVGLDGRVHIEGSVASALAHDEVLAREVSKDQEMLDKTKEQIDIINSAPADETTGNKTDGKLIVAEEIEIGRVSWSAMHMFFSAHSADHTVLFFSGLFAAIVFTSVTSRLETWFLGYWASQYGRGLPVPVFKRISAGVVMLSEVIGVLAYVYYALGSFNASKHIHTLLIESVFGTTFHWLDVTPTSRIIARFTGDTDNIDDTLSEGFWNLISASINMLTRLSAVILFIPLFFIPGALVGILGSLCGRVYLASQLSVKRELSNAKAPVLAHFGATMAGLVSVRAYGAQETLARISLERIDRLTRAARTFANLNRWVIIRVDTLSAIFAASLAYYLVYFQSYRPSNVGFSLNMALGFSQGILNWVRLLNQFEVQSNSLERIKQYIDIEQEPAPKPTGIPPAYWPASGNIRVENLSARYTATGATVLHGISFNIKSGERVGVVGRTGSGKSSLTLALLRCIFTEGTVYYDGIPTSSLNLEALRANITIIPQAPELLVGTVRTNVDILSQFDDVTLNAALRAAGLSALQENMEEGKLTLDSEIAAGGNNLSVGQRQIIALARAIIRGSKLLILDEVPIVDYKTDAVIQSSLRTELPNDTTILTVAHRLQTIMDADKIMVLDAGRIVEFDSPKALLQNKNGMLCALVDESGNKEDLYKMA
ncbi:P-loop containing nucleoside triphosphate hydrolase protein, partial [Mycena pura]